MPPKLSMSNRARQWSSAFPFFEVEGRGLDGWVYRCKTCCAVKAKTKWACWQALDENMKRGELSTHMSHDVHKNSVVLISEKEKHGTFWKKAADKVRLKKLTELRKKKDLMRAAFFLASKEIAINNYPDIVAFGSQLDGSTMDSNGAHSSVCSGWEMIESLDLCTLRSDCISIRNAPMHSLILDLSNDGDSEWMIVYARLGSLTDSAKVQFWDLVYVENGKSETLIKHLLDLYSRDDIDPLRCVGWGSDGAANMVRASILFQELLKQSKDVNFGLLRVHCINHRIDLSLASDIWRNSKLCLMIERVMRNAYMIFSRSHVKRRELQALRESFDRVLLPLPLIDIRWIDKRDCLRQFCASGPAIVEYMNGKDKLTPEEESVVEAVENHMHEFQAVLSILDVLGALTIQMQERSVDMLFAKSAITGCITRLQSLAFHESLNNLSHVQRLRDDLCDSLRKRIPSQEFFWLGLLDASCNYPSEVVRKKFSVLSDILPQLKLPDLPGDIACDYAMYYDRVSQMKSDGASKIDAIGVSEMLGLSMKWRYYTFAYVTLLRQLRLKPKEASVASAACVPDFAGACTKICQVCCDLHSNKNLYSNTKNERHASTYRNC